MTNVIEFPPPRADVPDADCVCIIPTDGKPVQWFKFSCGFTGGDGKRYGFHIWATDYAHADEMMAALRLTANVDGQVYAAVYE